KDSLIQNQWIEYLDSLGDRIGFCHIMGKVTALATSHPSKLRHSGDKAKLISSNDTSGFTFRGRFDVSEQVLGISYDATQKAHNALRWLISRQGFRNGDQAIIAWCISGNDIPSPMASSWELLGEETNKDAQEISNDSVDH